jgi:hypothetical protein
MKVTIITIVGNDNLDVLITKVTQKENKALPKIASTVDSASRAV